MLGTPDRSGPAWVLDREGPSPIILMKARRQAVVLELVRREPLRSQEQLRQRMRGAGFDVTQATLSRDIRELGLVKGGADGAYHTGSSESPDHRAGGQLRRSLAEYLVRVDRVQQLVLLRTGPGEAQPLGVAIDGAALPEVVATLAGDDTVLVVARDARRARAFVTRVEHLSPGSASSRRTS